MNVRGWGIGKLDDVCKELNELEFELVGLIEKHLRDDVRKEGQEYVMTGKG